MRVGPNSIYLVSMTRGNVNIETACTEGWRCGDAGRRWHCSDASTNHGTSSRHQKLEEEGKESLQESSERAWRPCLQLDFRLLPPKLWEKFIVLSPSVCVLFKNSSRKLIQKAAQNLVCPCSNPCSWVLELLELTSSVPKSLTSVQMWQATFPKRFWREIYLVLSRF